MVDLDGPEGTDRDDIVIGPIGPIPYVDSLDPVLAAQRHEDAAVAGALHTPAELQDGLRNGTPGVRRLVVDRLMARGFDHPGTLPALLERLRIDPDDSTRFNIAMVLYRFGADRRVVEALTRSMTEDPDPDVRAEAMSSLDELGLLDD